jgi:hypothetical protein
MKLVRFAHLPTGTAGLLYGPDGVQPVATVERPWLDNKPSVSCIPEGTYVLWPHTSPKFPDTVIELADVPGRSAILIHPANHPAELMGCIAPGIVSQINGAPSVTRSREAMAIVRAWFDAGDRILEVTTERAVL